MNSDIILLAASFVDASNIKEIVRIVAALGLLFGCISIATVHREQKLLDEWHGHESKQKSAGMDFKQWLKLWMESHKDRSRTHLYRRIECILSALAGKGGNKTLPSLRDLHDLTMQTEMSRLSPLALRVIVSCLLIIGIIGTLVGVHESIGHVTTRLDALKPALEPSMWAVGATVLLLFVRGRYVGMVDNFLSSLDTLTLNKLYVELQPPSDLKGSTSTLANKIDSFAASAKTISEATGNINDASKKMTEVAETLGKCSEQLRTLLSNSSRMLGELGGLNRQQGDLCRRVGELINDAEANRSWLEEKKRVVAGTVKSWSKMTKDVEKTVVIFDSIQRMSELLPLALEHIQNQGGLLEQLEQARGDSQTQLGKLGELHGALNENVASAGNQITLASQAYTDVDESIKGIIADKEGIRKLLEDLRLSIKTDTESISTASADCATAVNQLRAATKNNR